MNKDEKDERYLRKIVLFDQALRRAEKLIPSVRSMIMQAALFSLDGKDEKSVIFMNTEYKITVEALINEEPTT